MGVAEAGGPLGTGTASPGAGEEPRDGAVTPERARGVAVIPGRARGTLTLTYPRWRAVGRWSLGPGGAGLLPVTVGRSA